MQTVTRIGTLGLLIALSACGNDSALQGPGPTLQFNAESLTVNPGGSTMLSWSTTEAGLCTASGAWSGRKPTSGSESTGPLSTTSTFTLRCDGDGGTATDSVTVTVPGSQPPPVPTVTLNANPTTVTSGGSTQLTWSSTNANSCTASGGWSGDRPTSGDATINNLTANTTFTLECTGDGGSAQGSVTVSVMGAPPPPTVTLSANPMSVNQGQSSTLNWSSTNANSCTASSGWNGARQTSGTQSTGPLNATTLFVLACTGSGGTAQQSVTVTVIPAPPPTVSLSANPATINAGSQSTLTWNSTNATTCTASGAWNGPRATSGSQTVGPLFQDSVFTLTCIGLGGSASQSATVAVIVVTAGLQGQVDSSFVDIFGDNRIYVFSGAVTPDDMDGDSGDPVLTLPVTQVDNACTFNYAGGELTSGTYTIAFTEDAARDRPNDSDSLQFIGTRTVEIVATDVTADFRPDNILQVGPGRQFATLGAASAAATNGSVIEIDAGIYDDDSTVWRQNNVVIRGVGGRAHIRGTRVILFVPRDDVNNGLGLMVTQGNAIRVENMEFSGARVEIGNGAGIRAQGNDLTVCNGSFHDNENGLLGGGGTLVVEYSEFNANGLSVFGINHNIDVDDGDVFIFRHNYSHHVASGHLLRTRARDNHILYNRLMDEGTGTSGLNIAIPEGGLAYIIGNLIQQGPGTVDGRMVSYGDERLRNGPQELYLVNNTWVNDSGSGGEFVDFDNNADLVRTINNLFVGNGSEPSGDPVEATTNLLTDAPGLVNQAGFDYRLIATSPARNAGTAPGTARGVDLNPVYQYRHTANREDRVTEGSIDIGAYEFTP